MEVFSFGVMHIGYVAFFPSPVKFSHLFGQLSLACLPILMALHQHCVTGM